MKFDKTKLLALQKDKKLTATSWQLLFFLSQYADHTFNYHIYFTFTQLKDLLHFPHSSLHRSMNQLQKEGLVFKTHNATFALNPEFIIEE